MIRGCIFLIIIIGYNALILTPNTKLFGRSSSSHDPVSSRRVFGSSTVASLVVSFEITFGGASPATAFPFSIGDSKRAKSATTANENILVPVSYSDFKSLLRSDGIVQVTLSSDGHSLVSIDKEGVRRLVAEVPDDPSLLTDLIERKDKIELRLEDVVPPDNLDTARYIWKKLGGSIEPKKE